MAGDEPKRARFRTIADADLPAVCELLSQGFPERSRDYWTHALAALAQRDAPQEYPRYGYLIDNGENIVGVILTIFSRKSGGAARCNLSSWYVDPRYRAGGYASALIAAALRFKEAIYINVSPAQHTWPVIEAQGFRRYTEGQMLCFPALSFSGGGASVARYDALDDYGGALTDEERSLLDEHQSYGCQVYVVRAGDRAYPFVFLARRVMREILPTLQLIYCRDFDDFTHFAGVLGRRLALRGYFSVLIDASERPPDLFGVFLKNRGPKYFKGPQSPRLGDLSYCESVLFGP